MVASLLLYRKSLLPPATLTPLPDSLLDFEPTPVANTDDSPAPSTLDAAAPEAVAPAGSGWSRWFRRGKTLDQAAPSSADPSAGEIRTHKLPSVDDVDLAIDGDERPSPTGSKAGSAVPAFARSASVSASISWLVAGSTFDLILSSTNLFRNHR